MARIVLGMATSHTPQLATRLEQWRASGESAKRQPQHWFAGKTYSYDELLEARSEEHLERELTDDKFQTRWDECQTALARLAETLDRVAPDVCVIIGDDQEESFSDAFMPPFAMSHAATSTVLVFALRKAYVLPSGAIASGLRKPLPKPTP